MTSRVWNVAVDLTPVLPGGENGGAKVFVLELIRGMAELYPDCTFTLLIREESKNELMMLERQNVRLRSLSLASSAEEPSEVRPSPSKIRRVLRRVWGGVKRRMGLRPLASPALSLGSGGQSLLKSMGAELLFCPFTDPTYYEPGIPAVCTIYDLQYKTYPQFFSSSDVYHRDQAFLRAAEKATVLAAISDYSRDSAMEHGGIPKDRIETVHIRLAERVKHLAPVECLQQWNLSPQNFLIYPANFWAHKNHEVLLTAMGLAWGKGLPKSVKLVLTGAPGERRDGLKRAVERMGLADAIIFPGYVSTPELGTLIANSLGMVFPSLYEGFGMPVIEAMAMGVPVACSNLTSLPEVAGDAAILFDPRVPDSLVTALISLASHQALRETLISRGRERATVFSDHLQMAREYMTLFERALETHTPHWQMVGRYEDGWLGPHLWIQSEAGTSGRELELDFSTECWMPEGSVQLALWVDGAHRKTWKMEQGKEQCISVPLDQKAQIIEWRFLPVYVPSAQGLGTDERQLSLMLKGCRLKDSAGAKMNLLEVFG
jgi:glycosyltransferase involved in cell wall biosynthesis